jgi:hypothetical protein
MYIAPEPMTTHGARRPIGGFFAAQPALPDRPALPPDCGHAADPVPAARSAPAATVTTAPKSLQEKCGLAICLQDA